MDIRPCTAADLSVLIEKWPVPGGVHEAHASNAADGSTDYLVAWRDGEPLGSAVIRWAGYGGAEGRAAQPGAVEICHLQVRPERRGSGVGTALIAESERRAEERGRRLLAVGVGDDNPEARRLYERLGYRAAGIVDVTEYDWTDADGRTHHAREHDEMLLKETDGSTSSSSIGADPAPRSSRPERPKVVCLCGSLRFQELFHSERRRLTELGMIVLAPEPVDGELTPSRREALGELHLRRIDLADEVRVISEAGYVGETTRREIAYARALGTHITSTEPDLCL